MIRDMGLERRKNIVIEQKIFFFVCVKYQKVLADHIMTCLQLRHTKDKLHQGLTGKQLYL